MQTANSNSLIVGIVWSLALPLIVVIAGGVKDDVPSGPGSVEHRSVRRRPVADQHWSGRMSRPYYCETCAVRAAHLFMRSYG